MQKLWQVIKHLEYMPDNNSLTKINFFLIQKSEDITTQKHMNTCIEKWLLTVK